MDHLLLDDDPALTVPAVRRWLAETDPAPVLIETSGSTGRPKRVVLSRDAVVASARASAARLGGVGSWALGFPAGYVAGLQVVVRSLLAGHDPVLAGFDGAAYTSLVPTQLHRLLETADTTADLARLEAVLLGGGPIDPTLRARAEAAGIRVVATYGASETAGGCVYDGLPLDGVSVALAADGRIRIGGPTLFTRYDGDEELTARTLVDGWYLTSDAGRLDEDGHLQVLGRIDDVVLSGGVNVPLPAVAARLRTHPRVEAVEVLGLDDPEWGQRVVAFVVGDVALAEARDWVSAQHPRAWAPRQLVRLERLPLLANGKVDRRALQEQA